MIHHLISLIPYWLGVVAIYFILRFRDKKLSFDILWASTRTSLQLILLALALEAIFSTTSMIMGLILSVVMTFNSSWQIWIRSKYRSPEIFWNTLLSNTFAIWPIAFLFSLDQGASDWSTPQILLPLMGMLLGNSMSGVSIALETFLKTSREKKDEILTLLALGASDKESVHHVFFRSLKIAIAPQINSMISMGIVSIPGMMAGQLISKTDALLAATVQIKMMICICIGTVVSIYLCLWLARRRMFSSTGELCLE